MDNIVDNIKDVLSIGFNFKGKIKSDELPSLVDKYSVGDIVVDEDGWIYAKRDHYFEMIQSTGSSRYGTLNQSPKSDNRKIVTRCECCGAPLPITELSLTLGYVKCEYCDSLSQVFK